MTSGELRPNEFSQEEEAQREADGRWVIEELGMHDLMGEQIRLDNGRVLTVGEWTLIYDFEKYRKKVEPYILRYKEILQTMSPDDPERRQFEETLRNWILYYYEKYKPETAEV